MDEGTRGRGRGIQLLAWALIVTSAVAGWNALWGILHLAIAVVKDAPVAGAVDRVGALAAVVVFFLGIVALQCTAIALLSDARGAYAWLLCLCAGELVA